MVEPMEHVLAEVEIAVPTEGGPAGDSDSDSDSSASEYRRTETQEDKMQLMTNWLTNMNVVRAEIVRAVPSHIALARMGYAFRSLKNTENKLANFKRSQQTQRFAEFWSHSWQLGAWRKIWTLLFLKNGLAALCLGTVASLLGFLLSYTQILPSVLGFGGKVSFWSTLFGVVAFFLTLLFWRKQEPIFLDVYCINQVDNGEKSEGILSLGGILKRSEKMLVLWDKTYIERLWCVFELAAFMKSRGETKVPRVEMRPTLLGPCALAIFFAVLTLVMILATMISHQQQGEMYLAVSAAVLFVILYPAAATFRHYFHSVDTLCLQLREFDLNKTQCQCCTTGHDDEEDSICDRKIVSRCIDAWFGNQKEFEDLMKSVVLTSVSQQLGNHLFPYWLLLVSSVPLLWIMLDLAVENLLFMKLGQFWLFWLISGFGFWLGAFPTCIAVFLFCAKKLRQPRNLCGDVLMNLLVIMGLVPAFVLIFGILVVAALFTPLSEVPVAILCSCFHIFMAFILWFAAPRCCRTQQLDQSHQQHGLGSSNAQVLGRLRDSSEIPAPR